MKRLILAWLSTIFVAAAVQPAPNREADVVYGMYSGLALLMDVYRPEKPNGYGVVVIAGSGWHAPQDYAAQPLKDSGQVALHVEALLPAGYTVFAINHRSAPRFHYPAAVRDAQRAVRFIRHHAARFGIDAARLGAVGGSSGGHLVEMLGVLDGKGDPEDPDMVDRESAKVQCVVARAAPSDLMNIGTPVGGTSVASFLGMRLGPRPPKSSVEYRTYREASPIYHATPDDPPFLLVHGDADETVPFQQSMTMEAALKDARVPVKLIRVLGGAHGTDFGGAMKLSDYLKEVVAWLDRYLRQP
jgi:acetyl esterase/lipase